MKTGFIDLDDLCEFNPGDVVCIAGRPGMGKSTFVKQIAENLEREDQEISIDRRFLEDGLPDNRFSHTLVSWWDDSFSFEDLQRKDVVIVDSIQMTETKESGSAIPGHLRDLKRLAIENHVLVIVTSQISSKVDQHPSHRPMLSSLDGVWGMQEIADKIIFILRREYYDPMDKPGMAELIVAKNRQGALGNIPVFFENGKFSNYVLPNEESIDEEAFAAFTP